MITNNPTNFNPNALSTPGLYVVIQPPPGYLLGTASNFIFAEGTACWGPVNSAMLAGSLQQVNSLIGPETAASFADPHDLNTACQVMFQQTQASNNGQPAGIGIYLNRITDGTDEAATGHLVDTTAGTPLIGMVLTAINTGTLGNGIIPQITAGNLTGTFNLLLQAPAGLQSELYLNILGGSAGAFWTNAVAAINNGQGVLRGPSQLVIASAANASGLAPAIQTGTLSGGTDGRSSVTSSNFIGSAGASPPTGIYQMQTLTPAPSVAFCVGLTDTTVFTAIQALLDSLAIFGLLTFPTGTALSTALTSVKTLGINTPNVAYCKDWCIWYDGLTGQQKLVDPAAFIGGRIAVLSPEQSPLNCEIYGVIGTEHTNTLGGFQQYTPTDIGNAQLAGILMVTNNPPGGNYWGLPHGSNCSSDPVRHVIEYSRLTNWIAQSLNGQLGIFLGKLQSIQVNDPLRAQVTLVLNNFFGTLQSQSQIDTFKNVCDLTNNTPQSIAQHFLFSSSFVRYLSSVQYFIAALQGGTTVNITTGTVTEQQAAQIGV